MSGFYLERDVDASGVSGTGRVAQGFVFKDGTCALRWLTEHRSTAVYASLAELEAIHGHNGSTRIVRDAPCDVEGHERERLLYPDCFLCVVERIVNGFIEAGFDPEWGADEGGDPAVGVVRMLRAGLAKVQDGEWRMDTSAHVGIEPGEAP